MHSIHKDYNYALMSKELDSVPKYQYSNRRNSVAQLHGRELGEEVISVASE